MRILGVDPGLQCTGYGLIEASGGTLRLIEGGVIRTDSRAPLSLRLRTLHDGLAGILREYEPGCVVVEELYTKYAHPRTAILMGHARGMALLAAGEHGVTVVGYPASLIKRALTGNGRATKAQVGRMVCQVLRLDQPPSPDDVTDALALALCHASPARSRLMACRGRR